MSIAKYPAYKETGLEWLDAIPSHWQVRRLKQFCDVFPSNVDKKSVQGEPLVKLCNYTDVYYNDVVGDCLEFMDATATEEQIEKFSLKAGDTIITKDSETPDDIAIAAYVPKDLPGVICGYHLSMVRPKPMVEGAFVKRLFDAAYTKSLMAVRANGLTRVGLSQYAIDNVELPLPPKEEQASITAFLDRETAKIDALIAEQQRLIELLQEKRQAVISHAVTKGLNPNAPMKDSGVEWLGEVPEHWRQTSIKRIAKIFGRIGFRGYTVDDIVSEGEGAIALAPGNLKGRGFSLEKKTHISWAKYEESPEIKIEKNDVLLVKTGSTYGKCCFVDNLNEPATLNPQMVVFKETSIERELLFYILMSSHIQAEIKNLNKGSALPTVTQEGIGSIEIFTPPRNEQLQMIEHIKDKEARLFALIDQSKSSMRLLLERRSALISAAVTGQIDVRGLVQAEAGEQ